MNIADVSGVRISFTPAAMLEAHPPWAMESRAMWAPTRDEEHAVSTLTEGPLRP